MQLFLRYVTCKMVLFLKYDRKKWKFLSHALINMSQFSKNDLKHVPKKYGYF
jgi:hypothetical protein